MPKIKPRTSRRVPPPKDSDFDHEINLVDHSAPEPRTVSPEDDAARLSTLEPAAGSPRARPRDSSPNGATAPRTSNGSAPTPPRAHDDDELIPHDLAPVTAGPSIEIDEPTPYPDADQQTKAKSKPPSPETAIDILYENQRGGFLCCVPLFSSKALGNLDPPPWTNFAHKPSPTDIHTAQVPDPSWEWAWPDWRVNHDEGVDEGGWEYSFMFARAFSWHGPSWWNSFVRRRAWIRKRAKKDSGYLSQETSNMLNPDYFSVRPSLEQTHSRSPSRDTSNRASRISVSTRSERGEEAELPDIEDIESLLRILRSSRIDREKIEAIENYLTHGEDLVHLQEEMHEIMSLFVFQASRGVLLSRLAQFHEEAVKLQKNDDSPRLRRRAEDLSAAIKHADEEVRKLEYWSDFKGMADDEESKPAVDQQENRDANDRNLDKSGQSPPSPKKDTT